MRNFLTRTGKVGWLYQLLQKRRPMPLGAWGEWIALRHLRRMNWDILARNWSTRRGEIDLVAYHGDYIVFIEVKTLRIPSLMLPEDHVDDRKRLHIERTAMAFLNRHELAGEPIRFDLIAIETPDRSSYRLRHYLGFM